MAWRAKSDLLLGPSCFRPKLWRIFSLRVGSPSLRFTEPRIVNPLVTWLGTKSFEMQNKTTNQHFLSWIFQRRNNFGAKTCGHLLLSHRADGGRHPAGTSTFALCSRCCPGDEINGVTFCWNVVIACHCKGFNLRDVFCDIWQIRSTVVLWMWLTVQMPRMW